MEKARMKVSWVEFPKWNKWDWRMFVCGQYGENVAQVERSFSVKIRFLEPTRLEKRSTFPYTRINIVASKEKNALDCVE